MKRTNDRRISKLVVPTCLLDHQRWPSHAEKKNTMVSFGYGNGLSNLLMESLQKLGSNREARSVFLDMTWIALTRRYQVTFPRLASLTQMG